MEFMLDELKNKCILLKKTVKKKDVSKENGFSFSYNELIKNKIYLRNINFNKIIYEEEPKTCMKCKNNIPYEKRTNIYCSRSCAIKINNIKPKRKKNSLHKKCLNCKNIINNRRDFCSSECRSKYIYMNNFLEWYYNDGMFIGRALIIKGYISLIEGYKCNECGISNYNNKPLTLQLEHKNGLSNDNSRKNLCLLCPNCHSQTSTYGIKNKGNGREERRKRYQEGKSR